jgi:DNA excision repair protein ERCC-5
METVTDEMKQDIIKLLQLFGIPYVEAPSEAEAQCAALEELGLVDGIVTEDSDVFVFGGQAVYKNIFEDKMYAEAYLASDAKREMGLGRNAMVALAMLLGSDYTDGVKGTQSKPPCLHC